MSNAYRRLGRVEPADAAELAKFMETLAEGGASATTPQLSPQSSCASFNAQREGTTRAALPLSVAAQALHSRERRPADLAPIVDWHRSTLHKAQSSSSGEADGPGLRSAGHDSVAAGGVLQQALEGVCSSDTESQSCQPPAHSKEAQETFPDVKYQQVCTPTIGLQCPSMLLLPHCTLQHVLLQPTSVTNSTWRMHLHLHQRLCMQDANWDSIVDGHARELYLGVVQKLRTGVGAQQEWLKSAESAFLGTPQRDCARCKASSAQVGPFTAARSLSLPLVLGCALSPPCSPAAGRSALSSLHLTSDRQFSARAVTGRLPYLLCARHAGNLIPKTVKSDVCQGMGWQTYLDFAAMSRPEDLLLVLGMTHRGLTWAAVRQSGRPGIWICAYAQRVVIAIFHSCVGADPLHALAAGSGRGEACGAAGRAGGGAALHDGPGAGHARGAGPPGG